MLWFLLWPVLCVSFAAVALPVYTCSCIKVNLRHVACVLKMYEKKQKKKNRRIVSYKWYAMIEA